MTEEDDKIFSQFPSFECSVGKDDFTDNVLVMGRKGGKSFGFCIRMGEHPEVADNLIKLRDMLNEQTNG